MIPQRGTLGMVTRRNISLSGKKNYLWFRDHRKSFIPTYGNSRAIIWRSSKEWHTRTRMDDVNYLVEDKARDDFAYHRKWMGPMVCPLWRWSWTTTTEVQAGNKMQMLGMILVTGDKLNSREWFHCLNGSSIIEETGSNPSWCRW